jgi:tRNA threonylcarbamoyladenosine biosynthesis protein TsaB
LETATLGGSVFLARGSERLAKRKGNTEVSQSTNLLSDMNETLKEAGVSLSEVNLFACASGPGSFTGLRIGIATLKALAATLERPCVGIPSLQAVAHAAGPSSATVALLPAGRGEVFAQMFSVSQNSNVIELDSPAHLSPEKLVERYASFKTLLWAGSGVERQRDFLKRYAQEKNIAFVDDPSVSKTESGEPGSGVWRLAPQESNLAKHVAALALQLFQSGAMQTPRSLSAIYVRPSDAELNQQCR